MQNLKVKMGILQQWGPNDKKRKQAAIMVVKKWYQRCLNTLEGLIVMRMFLTKMNMSQTSVSFSLSKLHVANLVNRV